MSLEIRKVQVNPDRWTFTSCGDPVLPYVRSDGFYESFVNDDQVLDHITYRRLVATLIAVENELAEVCSQYSKDITTISNRLLDEAQRRGWCSEYDTIVAELNTELSVPLRERRVVQTITLEVSYESEASVTLNRDTVRAMVEEHTPFNVNRIVDMEHEYVDS